MGIMALGLIACAGKTGDDDNKKKAAPKIQKPAPSKTSASEQSATEQRALESFEKAHLAGEVNGQAWTQISGRVTAPNEQGISYLTLWDVDVKQPCNPVEVGQRAIVAKVALEPSRLELNEERTITLSVFDGEMVRSTDVKKGVLKIVEIKDGILSGAIKASHDQENHLEGSFEVVVCQ